MSSRAVIGTYDLKKREYISTTSMDSELALITANIALAGPGKLFFDPFVGTGSFPVACAHFGALGFGSDIDGRAIRGQGGAKSVQGNFKQYGLGDFFGSMFTSDLTNSPLRVSNTQTRLFDGIVCDPPYGVREGLKVLGTNDPEKRLRIPPKYGFASWLSPTGECQLTRLRDVLHFPPKKPYSFVAMLDNILMFAAEYLVDGGRLAFWMPTANDQGQDIPVPHHPCLCLVSVCTQRFNKCGFLPLCAY